MRPVAARTRRAVVWTPPPWDTTRRPVTPPPVPHRQQLPLLPGEGVPVDDGEGGGGADGVGVRPLVDAITRLRLPFGLAAHTGQPRPGTHRPGIHTGVSVRVVIPRFLRYSRIYVA